MKKRSHGEGSIYSTGLDSWRLRYRVGGRRYSKAFHGSKAEAKAALRDLLHSGDTGQHIAPDRMTVGQWIEHWISIGCPGNRKTRRVGQKSIERYGQLLRCHVLPALGSKQLQKVEAGDIDALYGRLEATLASRTARFVHIVLGACLGAAARTGKISVNPMLRIARAPGSGESDHGIALEPERLQELLQGFKSSPALYPIVVVAAHTGARRNEILALRWCDLDIEAKTLRIERSVEGTKAHGLRFKSPKTERGIRTIRVDDALIAMLVEIRESYLRLAAGVSDDDRVDLSLVKLPTDALIFPRPPEAGQGFLFVKPRSPSALTHRFAEKAARLGFPGLRFHDIRGTAATILLNAGVPVHVVAQRFGHDAATLLRSYAKHSEAADAAAANVIAAAVVKRK